MNKIEIQQSDDLLKKLFFEHVERKGECWIWTGYASPDRHYPLLQIDDKSYPAYRISLILHGRDLPNEIHALCGNKLCVNPDHLSKVKINPKRKKRLTTSQIREIFHLLHNPEYTLKEVAEKSEVPQDVISRILWGVSYRKQVRAIVNEPSYQPRLPGYYTTGEAIAKTGLTKKQLQDISRTEGWETYTAANMVLYKAGDIDDFVS